MNECDVAGESSFTLNHLVSTLRTSAAIPPLHPYVFTSCPEKFCFYLCLGFLRACFFISFFLDIYCKDSIYSVYKNKLQNCSRNQFE